MVSPNLLDRIAVGDSLRVVNNEGRTSLIKVAKITGGVSDNTAGWIELIGEPKVSGKSYTYWIQTTTTRSIEWLKN